MKDGLDITKQIASYRNGKHVPTHGLDITKLFKLYESYRNGEHVPTHEELKYHQNSNGRGRKRSRST